MTALLVGCAAEETPPLERKYHPEVVCVFIIILFRFALGVEPLLCVKRENFSIFSITYLLANGEIPSLILSV